MTLDHDGFRARLAAHLLGVLPDDEDAWMLEHADQCDACGARLARAQAARADWWEDAGHLPVATLRGWERDRARFAPADRAAIEAHLERCESCRADLEELAGRTAARPEPAASGDRAARGPRSRWFDRLTGGAFGMVATAAAFAIVSALWLRAPSPRVIAVPVAPPPRATPAPVDAPPPAVASPSPAPVIGPRVLLSGLARGAGSEVARIGRNPGDIRPLVPPLLDAPAPRVRVDLLDAAGRSVASRSMPGAELLRSGFPVDVRALPAGDYALRITWATGSGERDSVSYALRVTGER